MIFHRPILSRSSNIHPQYRTWLKPLGRLTSSGHPQGMGASSSNTNNNRDSTNNLSHIISTLFHPIHPHYHHQALPLTSSIHGRLTRQRLSLQCKNRMDFQNSRSTRLIRICGIILITRHNRSNSDLIHRSTIAHFQTPTPYLHILCLPKIGHLQSRSIPGTLARVSELSMVGNYLPIAGLAPTKQL